MLDDGGNERVEARERIMWKNLTGFLASHPRE